MATLEDYRQDIKGQYAQARNRIREGLAAAITREDEDLILDYALAVYRLVVLLLYEKYPQDDYLKKILFVHQDLLKTINAALAAKGRCLTLDQFLSRPFPRI